MRTRCFPACILLLALTTCASPPATDGAGDDPSHPGLAFAKVPAAINVNARFQVWVRINDELGNLTGDSETMVTIRASGSGVLHGTLTRRAIDGQVIFDDLFHDRWEAISLTLAASGWRDVTTRTAIPVRPLMRFVSMPPTQVAAGEPVGPFQIELVDGRGQPVKAPQPVELETDSGIAPAGGAGRDFATGQARYDAIVLGREGAWTLVWRSPGLADLVHPIRVHAGEDTESLWLPAGRVGAPYHAILPGASVTDEYRVDGAALPRGLTLEPSGELHGVPTAAAQYQLPIFAARSTETSVRYRADLSIFPAVETPPTTLDALDTDGPFAVGSLDDHVEVASRKATLPLRVFFPTQEGHPADGRFPLVAFHHGAVMIGADHPTVYDRYDHLLRRWASYGFVVATVDAPDLVWVGGRLVSATLANLNAMSENQRATIAYFKARAADPTFPLAARVDTDRVIAAGHSRGGGASLITARAEPSVIGGVLLQPLDPMGTVGGAEIWNIPLPPKPFLLMIAGADADLPYPMVDFLYERRAGPMVAPTVLGALHFFTCDASCPPDEGGVAGIPRVEAWSATNAFAVAFLRYAARGEVSFAPLLFGQPGLTTHLASQGTLLRADRAAAPIVVDDFQSGTAGRNRLGLPSADRQMTWSGDEPALVTALSNLPDGYEPYRVLYERPELQQQSTAHRLQWTADDAGYTTALGALDVSGRAAFVFRTRTDQGTIPPDHVSVRFRDTVGHTATVTGTDHLSATGIAPRYSDFILPLSELAAAGLDLGYLDTLEVSFHGGPGSVLIDDLRFE